MKKRVVVVLASLMTIGLMADVESQPRFIAPGKEDLPALTAYLVNQATKPLRFMLSEDGNKWRTYQLKAGASGHAATETKEVRKLSIRLRTGPTIVTSTLEFGQRYRLYWNEGESRWDVAQLEAE